MSMNIVHLSYAHSPQYSDPEAWLKRINFFVGLTRSMQRHATIKSIHCIGYEGRLIRDGVEFYFLNVSKFRLTVFPFRIHSLIRELNPDVIIIHGFHFPWQVFLLQRFAGRKVKIVLQHHAEKPLRFHKAFWQQIIDRDIEAYFFAGLDLAKPWLESRQIRDATKVHEVMEVSSVFSSDEIGASTTRKSKYLWVGRLDDNKDPVTLIGGFLHFAKRHAHVHLDIIFRGGDLVDQVIPLIDDEAKKYVSLIEDVPHEQLAVWYKNAGFILSTSHYEGSGTAVCEGMSLGCIPVVTDIASFRMMTAKGSVGVLFSPGDFQSLSRALTRTTTLDFEKEMLKSLKQYREELSNDAIAKKMINVISNL